MKYNTLTSILFLILCQSGCSTGTWVAELVPNETTMDGIGSDQFNDGCNLEIQAVPLIIHEVSLLFTASSASTASSFDNTFYDAASTETALLFENELYSQKYRQQKMKIAPGLATVMSEGSNEEVGRAFDSNNGAIGLYGVLSCGPTTVNLRWVFSQTIEYSCETLVTVPPDASTSSAFSIDPTQWFRQSTLEEGSDDILGQAILDADTNEDGSVTLYELSEIPLSTLQGYDDDVNDRIFTLFDHVETNANRVLTVNGTRCIGRN